jgi:hypothetical protein
MGSSSMLTFEEYLLEGRDAPLYHATNIANAGYIVAQNRIAAKTGHTIHPEHLTNPKYYNSYKEISGVSLTRNIEYAKKYMEQEKGTYQYLIFELDQRKLSHNYKMVPVNYYASGVKQFSPDAKTRTNPNVPYYLSPNEYEEYVIGPIKNLEKVLNKIIIPNQITWREYFEESILPNEILTKHPKLFYNGKFINA